MSETLNEPSVEVTETVDTVEPSAEDTGVQVDVWDEKFDVTDMPKEEVQETEPVKEVTEELSEYKVSGLGALDKPLVIKRKGKLYDMTDLDQIRNLVEKGLDSTVKNQELADMRRELLKEQNPDISEQELKQVDTNNEVERVAQNIMNSSYAEAFQGVVGSLPDSVTEQLRGDPRMLQGLSVDVESGLAMKIMPQVDRLMNVDGMSFKEAYMIAGKSVMDKQEVRTGKLDKLVSQPTTQNNVVAETKDIWSMSDSEFQGLMDTERR